MPRNKNMVAWCLRKAEKEIAQGQKHRGLVKGKPDQELAKEHLKKAEHNLQAFLLNKEHGFLDWTINIGFYTLYHCCLAIIAKFGYESRNQECTLALLGFLIEEKKLGMGFSQYLECMKSSSKKEEDQILPLRETYQYTPSIAIEVQRVEDLLKLCKNMIKETKGFLG